MRKREPYYPGTRIPITSPFFVVQCRKCGALYYDVLPAEQCYSCQSADISCRPADSNGESHGKVSRENA